jgi:hypothetical protein
MTAYDRSTLIAALLRAPLKNSDTVKLITRAELARLGIYERYAKDILRIASLSRSNAMAGWSGSISSRCDCSAPPDSPQHRCQAKRRRRRRRPDFAS